jgi:protein subunit release factor A
MKPLTYAERLELDALFERMAEVEDRVRTVAAKLSDPTLYAKAEEARELAQVHAEVLAEEVALMARWEELEKRREATRG